MISDKLHSTDVTYWLSCIVGFEKQSIGLALHSYNTIWSFVLKLLIMRSSLYSRFHTFSFLFKTWHLHYPQCNSANGWYHRRHLIDYMQLPLEPQKALENLFSLMQLYFPIPVNTLWVESPFNDTPVNCYLHAMFWMCVDGPCVLFLFASPNTSTSSLISETRIGIGKYPPVLVFMHCFKVLANGGLISTKIFGTECDLIFLCTLTCSLWPDNVCIITGRMGLSFPIGIKMKEYL